MAYANKYLFRFGSQAGKDISIYVQQDGFSGTVTQRPLGQAPVLKKEKNGPVCGTSLTFYPECHVDQEFAEFYTSDPKEYKVRVLIGSTATWEGYITPELYAEPDIAPPYDVEVVATDGLGELKLHDYEARGLQTLRAQLVYLLGLTGLGTTVYISSELSVTAQSVVSAGGLLDGVKVNLDYMAGESCYDVLTAILDTLHAEIMYHRGAWLVSRETDLTITGGKVEYYNTAGTKSTFANSVKTEGKMGVADMWPVGKLTTRVEPAKNQITVQAPWHPATAIANPYMTSDTGWHKTNNAQYNTTKHCYQLNNGNWSGISQDIPMQGLQISMHASVSYVGFASTRIPCIGFTVAYTVNGTTYYLQLNNDGEKEWVATSRINLDWQQNINTLSGERSDAATYELDIPAFYLNGAFPAGTLSFIIYGRYAYVFNASLDAVVPYGWQDTLTITNDARGAGDTTEILFGKETTDMTTYRAFMQGVALTATGSNLCTSWSDKRWSNLDFLALTSRGYALSVAAPRLNSTGTLQVPSLTYIPLVIAEGSINFWLREWTWNLLEDELEIDAISLPSATLTVSDETVEAMGGTAQSSTSPGSTGGGGGGAGGGHTHDNKEVLDGITAEKVEGWDDAAEKAHTHSNKVLLDSYTQTEANLASAVSQKHTHSNKAVIDDLTRGHINILDLFEYNATNHTLGIKKVNNTAIHFWTYGDVVAGGIGGETPGGAQYLYQLQDVPDYRTSYRGKYLRSKSDGSGLEWADAGGGSGTVTQVKVGTTPYDPVDGVVTLPAYPSYTLPAATANALGGIKIGASVTGKNYAVQLDANNKAYVSVPWENTTYSDATTSAHGLMTAAMVTKLNGIATGATAVSSSTVLGWGFVKSVASKTPDSSGNVALSAADVGAFAATGGEVNSGSATTRVDIVSSAARLWLISYSDGKNYIESANAAGTGNAELYLAGYNATQGSNLHLRFANIYATASGYTVYHSGNLTAATLGAETTAHASQTYVPLAGGTMTGALHMSGNAAKIDGNGGNLQLGGYNSTNIYLQTAGKAYYSPASGTDYELIHAGNIASQSVAYASNSGQLGGLGEARYFRKNLIANSADCNTMEANSFTILNTDAGSMTCANKPEVASIAGGYGVLTVKHGSYSNQIFFPFGNTGDLYTRSQNYVSGTGIAWGDWNTIYHSRNANNTTTPWTASTFKLPSNSDGSITGSSGQVVFVSSNYNIFGNSGKLSYLDGSAIYFRASNTTAAYIGSNAFVGIGTTAPTNKVHIKVAGNNPLRLETTGADECSVYYVKDTTQWVAGVGLGAADAWGWYNPTARVCTWIDWSGNFVTKGEVTAGSDARWKHNIAPVANGIDVIMKLQPSEWLWNSDNHTGYGLIAQEVREVIPALVKEDSEGYLHLTYDGLHAFEISALQNHESRIETLERENRELKAQIARLSQ